MAVVTNEITVGFFHFVTKADFWRPDNADLVRVGTEVDVRFPK